MKEKIRFLPMVVYSFSRNPRRKLKAAVLLCFFSSLLFAQSDQGMVMATCGYSYGDATQHTIVAYQLEENGVLSSVYGDNVTFDNLGSVYGVTMDNNGDYYITAGGLYGAGSNLNFRTHGNNESPTMIYKIDGSSIKNGKDWYIQDLVIAGDFEVGENTIPNPAMCGPRRAGLGNIAYNARHDVLYATNFSDGKIYQLGTDGKVMQSFDPKFDGKSYKEYYGYAPLGQRAWAVAVKYPNTKKKEERLLLYYSRWTQDGSNFQMGKNEIWAVELNSQNGEVIPSTERKIKTLKTPAGLLPTPIGDIEFDVESEKMLLTEHRMKSHNSYVVMESQVGKAFELVAEKDKWKKVENPVIASKHVTYGLSEKTPKSFAPDQFTIIDLGKQPDVEEAIIGDVDFNQARRQAQAPTFDIDIYPNPTSGLVQVEGKFNNATYVLLNNNGQVLQKGILTTETNVIDLSNRSNGTYLLSIVSEDQVFNKKINKMD